MKLKSLKKFQQNESNNTLKQLDMETLNGGSNGRNTFYSEGVPTGGGIDCTDWVYFDNGMLFTIAPDYGL